MSEHEEDPAVDPELRTPWGSSERPLARLVARPLQRFVHTESGGGILLLAGALAALIWANSPWFESYERFWHTELTFDLGAFSLSQDLRHWINDGLMAIFFFVVGLEIKRELVTGELRDPRAAALPGLAALGGMVVPALIYLALAGGGEAARGWGIAMATDIAFAVGILALLGRSAPSGLRLFLLSLAIVDDIGAVLVIAIFYTESIAWPALAVAAALLAAIVLIQRVGVRWVPLYVLLGLGVWLAVFSSGVHATIAGVALGLVTPAVPFQRPRPVSLAAKRIADETADEPAQPDEDAHHWLDLATISREAVSPLARMENILHPWTSYLVVPLFAIANAGVHIRGTSVGDVLTHRVTLAVAAGLVIGKIVGVSLASWLAVRLGLSRLPEGVEWPHVIGAAALAGIGFTVSLFVAGLAFSDAARLDAAKIGVLGGSVIAGVVGAALLRRAARRRGPSG